MVDGFTLLDAVALAVFFSGWIGYGLIADKRHRSRRGIAVLVDRLRERWAKELVQRELRMLDALILTTLMRGTTFFASTTILMVGGLLALVGASDIAVPTLNAVPFAVHTPQPLFQFKALVLVGVLIYAFVKFVWAYRLNHYTSILIGAAPAPRPLDEQSETYARELARLSSLGGSHFNRGLRALFFALAMLAWFLQPLALVAATLAMLAVLWRRDFRSRSLRTLQKIVDAA